MGERKALLIGINEYDFLGELKYAQQDAEAISVALQQYCGFDSNEITVMSCQARKSRRGLARYIEHAISSLRNYRDLEMLVFGFWGHGFSPSPGQRYLCGLDTDENDLERTAVSFDFICSQLAQVQAENTLLLLDCCQNAPSGRGAAETMTKGEETVLASMARDIQASQKKKQRHIIPTVAVLNACSEGQKAYEWPDREHGVFTAHLLDAFDQGFGSVAPMAAWTAQQVVKTSHEIHHQTQIPYVKIEGCGDIFLPKSDNTVSSKPRPKVRTDPDKQKKMRYQDTLIQATEDGEITRKKWQDMLALRDELGLEISVYHDVEKKLWGGTTLDEVCSEYIVVQKPRPVSPKSPPRIKSTLLDNLSLNCGDGVHLEMKLVSAGEFMMGSRKNCNEKPVHKVTILKPFYMGIYPVTQVQYKAVMSQNPSKFKGHNNPVERVRWDDAIDFCEELSNTTGQKITLPSEAMWEYACRAGSKSKCYFDDSKTSLSLFARYFGRVGKKVRPVGKGTPNDFGLHDMHGDVWEWCQDLWHDSYRGAPNDGRAWIEGGVEDNRCVIRGGTWVPDMNRCQSAFYRRSFRVDEYGIIGFRIISPVSSLGLQ